MFKIRLFSVLVVLTILVVVGVGNVGAQEVTPVYPANNQALCDFTYNLNVSGGDFNAGRFLQDNGDGIVLKVTHDGWFQLASDKQFTVFIGTWDEATKSILNPDAGTLATADGARFVYNLDEAHKLVVGQGLLMVANCHVNVADDVLAPVQPNDPAVCDPSFARSAGSGNLVRKLVDGSRVMYFGVDVITSATFTSDTPFIVFRGMIDGNSDLVNPTAEYSFTTDAVTYQYVIAEANKLELNNGLMVVWPCTPTSDADFMSHFTSQPNVDWCNARVIDPESTTTVHSGCVVSGDVKVNGNVLYDNSEFTGLVVAVGSTDVEVYAQWGGSVWPAGTAPATAQTALMATGCVNGGGCSAVNISQ